jgi:hypothetical protein
MFKRSKIELPYDPAISLLGIYPKELKTESLSMWLHKSIIPALGRLKQEGKKFEGSLGHIVSSRPSYLENKTKMNKQKPQVFVH